MKIRFLILMLVPFFASCEKEDSVKEVTFKLNISDFQITSKEFGSLKSQSQTNLDFVHKYPPATLTFTNFDAIEFSFQTGSTSINEFSITLPVGEYTLTGSGGEPNRNGSPTMSFTIPSQTINISESTTSISITVTPNCALVIVYDENSIVETAWIHESQHTLIKEGNLYYKYFQPRDRLYIYKTDGAYLNIATNNMQTGYLYQIIVTDSGTTQTIEIDPGFTAYDIISW